MSFEGSCHCGAVAYTVEADFPTEAVSCNCSHCRRKGLLLAFVPESVFSLTRGEDVLRTYQFNTHRIDHQFCTECGTQAFASGGNPDGSAGRAINLRCLPAIDLDSLQLKHVDGARI